MVRLGLIGLIGDLLRLIWAIWDSIGVGKMGIRVLKKEIGQGFWGLCQGSIWLDRNRNGFGDCIRVRASSSRKIRLGRGCGGERG